MSARGQFRFSVMYELLEQDPEIKGIAHTASMLWEIHEGCRQDPGFRAAVEKRFPRIYASLCFHLHVSRTRRVEP